MLNNSFEEKYFKQCLVSVEWLVMRFCLCLSLICKKELPWLVNTVSLIHDGKYGRIPEVMTQGIDWGGDVSIVLRRGNQVKLV